MDKILMDFVLKKDTETEEHLLDYICTVIHVLG